MYKETTNTYVLSEKDKLVITYENGRFLAIINNDTVIYPVTLDLSSESFNIKYCNGKAVTINSCIKLTCEE